MVVFGFQWLSGKWKSVIWKNKWDNEVSDFFWKCNTLVSQQPDFSSISPQQFFSISSEDKEVFNEIDDISSPQ